MSAIQVVESMIGLKVTTLQGNKDKIIDVTNAGYKLEERRSQVKAKQLVKKGKGYMEIERPPAKTFEDSGMGYVTITDPDLYKEIFGKKMPGAKKSKAEKPAKDKKSSKKSSKKADKKSKPAKAKAVVREDLELLTDHGNRVPMGLRSAVELAITQHLTQNFNLPGSLRVVTEMDVFEFIGDDGGVGSMNVGIHFDLPNATVPKITDKTMSKVKQGLWEKNEKLRKLSFKKFGADFDLHDVFVDEDGNEYIFAGVNINKKKKPVMVFHRPEDETCITCPVSVAADRLELSPNAPESEDDELDLSDYESDMDLADAEELEEAVADDNTALVSEEHIESLGSVAEIVEYLTENFDANIMTDYFNSTFEDVDKRDKRVLKSGDEEAIATMIAEASFVPAESDEEIAEGSSSDVDGSDDFGSDESDGDIATDEDAEGEFAEFQSDESDEIQDGSSDLETDADVSDADEILDDASASDVSDAEEEIDEDDLDTMLDALVDGNHITNKESRKLAKDPAAVAELYNEHFGEEEGIEIDIDDATDQLVEDKHITNREARKMEESEILALYNSVYGTAADSSGSDVDGSDEELVIESDGSDVDDSAIESDGSDIDISSDDSVIESDGSDISDDPDFE